MRAWNQGFSVDSFYKFRKNIFWREFSNIFEIQCKNTQTKKLIEEYEIKI